MPLLVTNYGGGFVPSGGGGGSPAWTPDDLSAGAALEAWWSAADLSTLFQDTGGATAVTADGDPIGRWEDKTGNGNHLTQGTASEKPTYKTSGGLHWSQWDGSNDRLLSGTLASHLFTSTGGWLAVAYEAENAELLAQLIAEQVASTDFRQIALWSDTRSSPNRFAVLNVSGTGDNYINYPAEQAADVRSAILNNESGTLKGYHDGSVLASTTAGAELSGSTRIDLGWRRGTTQYHQGKIFEALAGSGTLSSSDITDLTAYLKGKAGI